MSQLREILRPEAGRRARVTAAHRYGIDRAGLLGGEDIAGHLDILCDDLDANCRAFAVALGGWSEPWPEGESAPRLEHDGMHWTLRSGDVEVVFCHMQNPYKNIGFRPDMIIPGLDAFTAQSQAMGAARCIWAALEMACEKGGQP